MKLVSVIMPTYNTPYSYLEKAVESILNQSYKNIELIIIDDTSTKYNDFVSFFERFALKDKIKLIKNINQKGVAGALNTGIEFAKGEYIVRMDSDDISELTRIEKQVKYLEENQEIGIVAGYAKCFGDSKKWHKSLVNDIEIKTRLLFQGDLVHPTICFRKSIIDKYNLRYRNVQNEDYDLWIRCSLIPDIKFFTIPEKVLLYRVHKSQVTKSKIDILINQGINLRKEYLTLLKINLTTEEKDLFARFALGILSKSSGKEIIKIEKIIEKKILEKKNSEEKKIIKKIFWCNCCQKCTRLIIKGKINLIWCLIRNIYYYITV